MNRTTLFRWLSALCFASALMAIGALLVFDVLNQMRLTSMHQRAGALSFILIGSSYIGLQFSSVQRPHERARKILLGGAFLLWGCEQFVPAGPWATAMDTAVILIFVFDLGSIIVERLKQKNHG